MRLVRCQKSSQRFIVQIDISFRRGARSFSCRRGWPQNPTGAIIIYRKNNKPALGPVATVCATSTRVGGSHDQGW